MKSSIATILFSLILLSSFAQKEKYENPGTYKKPEMQDSVYNNNSQNLWFEIRPTYKNPLKKEKVNSAQSFDEISSDYPKNWLSEYVSTEISTTTHGKTMAAVGKTGVLTEEQKRILNSVDIGSEIRINNKYKSKNSATDKIEIRNVDYIATVIPDVEAEYFNGQEQMMKYLKENAINKISERNFEVLIRFTVNESGEISNSKIKVTSNDSKIDRLLLDTINNMPKWKPAQNSKGVKVKQEFEFSVGNGGC
jgi:TonB family protein